MKLKKNLFIKQVIGYLLFAVLSFLIVSTFTYHQNMKYIEEQASMTLSRDASLLASRYAASYYNHSLSQKEMKEHMVIASTNLSAPILLVDPEGKIILSSRSSNSFPEQIPDFSITDFGNRYYQIGNFYGLYPDNMMTVFASIPVNYKVQGYIIISKPVSDLNDFGNGILTIAYQTLALVIVIALLFIAFFVMTVLLPLWKLTHTAGEYAKGNFEPKISIQSNDEIGYLAASLNYMANELHTLESDQRKFISNVSHDFRSPLTSIKGYVEAILDGTIPLEMQDKYLNIILFETERLNKLTTSLLELNKCGVGNMLDITRFDLNQIIKHTVQSFEGICKTKHISFELVLTGSEMYVKADMSKIQQVLYNLIDNAIKFSYNDSFIKIETTTKNDKIFVSVKDSGIGIPKNCINKIWERFYKTDLSRGKDKKGTGLGLAIVKEIITSHNENINVISTEGVGTEFIFTLPMD
ncbi:MAG: sensor histidine kinase [Lachnospiraceae bacterium]